MSFFRTTEERNKTGSIMGVAFGMLLEALSKSRKGVVARWLRSLHFNTNEAVEEAVTFLSQRQKLKHTKPCQRKTG